MNGHLLPSSGAEGLVVTRVALTPFDTRTATCLSHDEVCDEIGLKRLTRIPWIERLIGDTLTVYEVGPNHLILLSSQGFGLNLRREHKNLASLEEHASVTDLVLSRAHHHELIRNGAHEDVTTIGRLKADIAKSIPRSSRKFQRPDIWEVPPYTLSFFYIPEAASRLLGSKSGLQGLSALLEPSQILKSELVLQENEHQYCTRLIDSLSVERLNERYRDSDIKAGVATFCSWAGVVAFDEHGCDLPYLESLEIRLQLAWLKAHFVRKWAEKLLTERSLEPDKLSRVAAETTPLVRQCRRLIDATASTRDQELFDELIETSDLDREISGAEEAIDDVHSQIDLARAATRRRFDKTIEALLLLLAFLEIVPFIFVVPFAELPNWYLAPLIVIVASLVIIRALKT